MINYQLDAQGIAILTWDMPGRSQNVINASSGAALIAAIEQVANDPAVNGILMTSAKADFIAGGDLEWLLSAQGAAELFERTMALHRALRRLETCGKPVAMALPGSALGGGLEIALAGHYRVAADQAKARFGLPEVTLGLLPGGGGTQRLPRLIGIQPALPLLLEGKKLKAADALALGILHAVVPVGTEIQAAYSWLQAQSAPVRQPWDGKGYKIPGGAVGSPAVQQVLVAANAMLRAKTYGNYPALAHILSCVYEGLLTNIDTGLKTEARYFVNCVLSPQAKNMIRSLFFNLNEASKRAARPRACPERKYSKIGVLGAGMMGQGVAYVGAKAGLAVVLLDATQEGAERGKAYTQQLLDKQVARGQISAEAAAAMLARISTTTDYAQLHGAELVVEAVFEDRTIKADVTRLGEAVLAQDAIFASNTSTLPISSLAEASARPAQFIGLHFFSPVDKMPLVEVIVGKATSQETLAHSLDFVKALGMTPIVVNDARGFYTSRVFSTYVLEGLAMLAEGVAPALIENAGLQAGMPIGPLGLTDEVSAELIVKIDRQAQADLGNNYRARPGLDAACKIVALGRIGKKAGAGFYNYPADGKKSLWPGLAEHFPVSSTQPDFATLVRRLLVVQSVETVRCLEEGVLITARDADVGSLLGWGFPPYLGGTIGQINSMGIATFVAECTGLAARFGERFSPPQLLRDMIERGVAFYD